MNDKTKLILWAFVYGAALATYVFRTRRITDAWHGLSIVIIFIGAVFSITDKFGPAKWHREDKEIIGMNRFSRWLSRRKNGES